MPPSPEHEPNAQANMSRRIVRIVPLVRMPRSLGFFDYGLPDGMDADVGEFVYVPFRGRKLPALVVDTPVESDVPASKLKDILEVMDEPALGTPVVKTILSIAEASLTSPATAANALLPDIPKRKTLVPPKASGPFTLPESHLPEPPLWHDAFSGGPTLFAYDDEGERQAFLECAVRHAHAADRPLLHIAPRVEDAKAFAFPYGAHAAVVTGLGATGARWTEWRRAAEAGIVAGTSLALFTPHRRPFAIVVDDEGAAEHRRSDAAPRFDACAAAEEAARTWGCPVIFLSSAPSVALWSRLGGSMRLIPSDIALPTRTVICDFGDEFRSKRFSPVSLPLLDALERALEAKTRAVLIVNRKGDSARLVCRDCRRVTACPTCASPLAVHGARLVCPRCRLEEAVPDECPSCHGTRLAGSGAGIDRIAEFLSSRFPKASVATYTKDAHPVSALKADIVLGTEYLMTHARVRLVRDPSLGFVGTLSADTFLMNLADALTPEREFRRLRRLALLAASHDVPLHLQTSEPELPLYAMLAMPLEKWYRMELDDRETSGIYPYSGILRLVAAGSGHAILKGEAEALASRLKSEGILSIFEVRIVRSGNRSKAWIGISYPLEKREDAREAVSRHLPESWGLDPAPFEPVK